MSFLTRANGFFPPSRFIVQHMSFLTRENGFFPPSRFIVHGWTRRPDGTYFCTRCERTTMITSLFLDSTSGVPRVDCLTALAEEVMES